MKHYLGLDELPPDWRARFGYVYIIKNAGLYKIGSAKKLHIRMAQLRTAAPSLEEIHAIPSISYRLLEKALHRYYADKRQVGEWFSLTESDLDFIAQIDGEGHRLMQRIAIDQMKADAERAKRQLLGVSDDISDAIVDVDKVLDRFQPYSN